MDKTRRRVHGLESAFEAKNKADRYSTADGGSVLLHLWVSAYVLVGQDSRRITNGVPIGRAFARPIGRDTAQEEPEQNGRPKPSRSLGFGNLETLAEITQGSVLGGVEDDRALDQIGSFQIEKGNHLTRDVCRLRPKVSTTCVRD